jgi:hypothetical protein
MKYVWVLVSPLVLALTGLSLSVLGPSHEGAAQPTYPTAAFVSQATSGQPLILHPLGTPEQPVLAGTVLLARGQHHAAKGTRSDQEFFQISSTGSNDVPEAALRAYHRAEKTMATADPDCDISWTMLAAIGRVESNHGRFAGAQLGSDGVSRPEIRGPQLNGAGPFAAIRDSDRGVLDHDKVWDRAVGQMQFLPQTWHAVARDGDGDGKRNPDDIDDSALGAAVYLCGAGGSLADSAGMARAAFRYNHSDYYVQLVLSFQNGYRTGVFAVPSPPPPAPKKKAAAVKHKTRKVTHKPTRPASKPKPTPAVKPTPKPAPTPKPTPKPSPKPTPTPSGPRLSQVGGTWQACGPDFCLGTTVLDLGPQNVSGDHARADFDGDGNVESNGQEFAGLVDKHVNLQVERKDGRFVVYVIGGDGFRNADGSFARAAAQGVASSAPSPSPAP